MGSLHERGTRAACLPQCVALRCDGFASQAVYLVQVRTRRSGFRETSNDTSPNE